jgi:hypothetical protein
MNYCIRIPNKNPKSNILIPTQDENKKYSLNQGTIIPPQGSPPNDFMLNLIKRILIHDSFLMKDDNRNSE